MKKNYVVFDEYGIIKRQHIKNLVATSAEVDVVYILADFDQASNETAYRCSARVQRADGFVVGPVSMPASMITAEEAAELGVGYQSCRQLTMSKTMMAVDGPIQITVIYDQLDVYGKVISTQATAKVVANIMGAVEQILTEDEIAELRQQFLPRDLTEITLAEDLDDASLILGQQDGITKRIGMLLIKQYIQDSTIINLGNKTLADLNAIMTQGMYRLSIGGLTYILIVDSDKKQKLFNGETFKVRAYDTGYALYQAWKEITITDLFDRLATAESNISKRYTKEEVDDFIASKVTKNNSIVGGTKPKVTYDSKGLVTSGEDLIPDDIPTLPQSKITNLTTDLGLKADKTSLPSLFKAVTYNSTTGELTFTKYDNSTATIDLPMELIVTSGSYDDNTKKIILTLANGDKIEIPVGALLTELNASVLALQTDKVDKTITINGNPLNANITLVKADVGLGNVSNDQQATKTEFDTYKTNQSNAMALKVDKDFSGYDDIGTIESTDVILLNKGGVHKKTTIAGLTAKITTETGAFVASADYSAQGLGADKAVKDSEGKVIKDTYLKKGTAVLTPTDVESYTLDSNPIDETVKVTKITGKPSTVVNNVIVNSSPKQIISKSNNLLQYTAGTITKFGITATIDADGTLTINGTPTAGAFVWVKLTNGLDIIGSTPDGTTAPSWLSANNVFKAGTYTVKRNFVSGTISSSVFTLSTSGPNFEITQVSLVSAEEKTTSVLSDSKFVALYIGSTSSTYTNYKVKFQINLGSTALPYQPYAVNTYTISTETQALYPNGMGKLPNGVADEISGSNFVKKVGRRTLNENNSYAVESYMANTVLFFTATGDWGILLNIPINATNCNLIVPKAIYSIDEKGIFLTNNGGGCYFRLLKTELIGYSDVLSSAEKVALLKTWLITNNIIIDYQLATPIITPITPLPNIQTYEKGTITVDNGLLSLEIPVDITSQVNTNTKSIHKHETDINSLNANKVDKVENSRLITDTEATKLENIENNAQVNVIDGIMADGELLDVVNKKVILPMASTTSEGLMDRTHVVQIEANKVAIQGLNGAIIPRGTVVETTASITANKGLLQNRIIELFSRYPIKGDALKDSESVEWYYDGSSWNNLGQNVIVTASDANEGLIQTGYTENGANIPVKVSGKKAYATVTKGAVQATGIKLGDIKDSDGNTAPLSYHYTQADLLKVGRAADNIEMWSGNKSIVSDAAYTKIDIPALTNISFSHLVIEWENATGTLRFTSNVRFYLTAINKITNYGDHESGGLTLHSCSCRLTRDDSLKYNGIEFNNTRKYTFGTTGTSFVEAPIYITRIIAVIR